MIINNMNQLKNQILTELKKAEFPDLKFLFSKEALEQAPEILEELLEQEKGEFEELLLKNNQTLTFESLEDEGILSYYWSLLNHLKNVDSDELIRKIIEDFRPKLEDFGNYVAYNKEYFEKLQYIDKNSQLDEEQKRIMFLRIKAFKDRGIDLNEEEQTKLKELNKKLSKLWDDFNNNIVDDEEHWEYTITDFEVIKDLPKEVLEIAEQKYKNSPPFVWKEGQGVDYYLFDADPTSYIAIMKYCSDSKIRQDFEKARTSFASSGKHDNRWIVLDLLKWKQEKASILGYKNYAELSLNDKMADSPEQVFDLIKSINKKARKKALQEIENLKTYFNLEEIHSYDLAYYSRKIKEEKYDLDDKELKKYFEYGNVLNYLHNFVKQFYGIEMKELSVDTYNEDVKIYEVHKDGKFISYYFLDSFYRKSKRPGAWADDIRSKTYDIPEVWVTTKVPVIVNVCNFQKSDSGKTTLSMRDVETIFHEFGHAIHEMLSESKHSELSGFGVEWDFVELPSQLLENWVWEEQSLTQLARHVDSWEAIPKEMLEKLEALKTFMSGSFVARQNEFALLDMTLYSTQVPETVEQLDENVLKIVNEYSLFKRGTDYKTYASFWHIFGWGYAAGYYSYMWAEIIEADIFETIKELWMFNREVWEKFIATILWQWTRKKASELFFDFMWREVSDYAFMQRKGL